ncbi:VrrA/YqfQ family protein [Halalkalibacter flavus]|uniref:VrrA/YqfQ family protein n=1 Tax=Halalkalibacter flavus TaxID=3090668 RepID=UPI002FC9B229
MQPFFGPPFGSMPMQAPMQGMSHTANMFSHGIPTQAANAFGGAGSHVFRGGGGFLSRILGGLGGAQGAAGNPMMGGFLSAGGGGMNFSTLLTNAQKVLGLTHQVVPMIQQYGPLIRNAPTIWKIMMSNNSEEGNPIDDSSVNASEDEESTKINIEEPDDSSALSSTSFDHSQTNETDSSLHLTRSTAYKPESIKGIPGPKLYI